MLRNCMLLLLLWSPVAWAADAGYPLEPPDLSSPRATLNTLLTAGDAYLRLVRDEYWDNPSSAVADRLHEIGLEAESTLDLSKVPSHIPKIAGTEVKWWKDTELYRITQPFFPDDLSPDVEKRLKETAVEAYRALKCRDYGRVDMRLTKDGKIHVLEVNPNPWLISFGEFGMAWLRTGKSYPELIQSIVGLATARYAEPAVGNIHR